MQHHIRVSITDPTHQNKARRSEVHVRNVKVSANNHEDALTKARKHYEKMQYKVKDCSYIGNIKEEQMSKSFEARVFESLISKMDEALTQDYREPLANNTSTKGSQVPYEEKTSAEITKARENGGNAGTYTPTSPDRTTNDADKDNQKLQRNVKESTESDDYSDDAFNKDCKTYQTASNKERSRLEKKWGSRSAYFPSPNEGKKTTKESVEPVQELSASLLNRYMNKADQYPRKLDHLVDLARAWKKTHGVDKVNATESVEPVSELSRTSLHTYVKHAKKDVYDRTHRRALDLDDIRVDMPIVQRRREGIELAKKKLKEAVDLSGPPNTQNNNKIKSMIAGFVTQIKPYLQKMSPADIDQMMTAKALKDRSKDPSDIIWTNLMQACIEAADECLFEQYIPEHLDSSASVKDWIDDFQQSKNPKFDGKSPEERKKMALGAYYSMHKESFEPVEEDFEEVEELSKSTLSSYMKKATASQGKVLKDKNAREAGYKVGEKPDTSDLDKIDQKRFIGKQRAADRLYGVKENEQLDELSKKTLGSYINKANKDSNERSELNGWRLGQGTPATQRGTNTVFNRNEKKIADRKTGIARAVNRLTKEDIELQERDEGKPGKNFNKIANSAAKEYGSKEAGERVAGAIRAKLKTNHPKLY